MLDRTGFTAMTMPMKCVRANVRSLPQAACGNNCNMGDEARDESPLNFWKVATTLRPTLPQIRLRADISLFPAPTDNTHVIAATLGLRGHPRDAPNNRQTSACGTAVYHDTFVTASLWQCLLPFVLQRRLLSARRRRCYLTVGPSPNAEALRRAPRAGSARRHRDRARGLEGTVANPDLADCW
jgi:hypothetical protein